MGVELTSQYIVDLPLYFRILEVVRLEGVVGISAQCRTALN